MGAKTAEILARGGKAAGDTVIPNQPAGEDTPLKSGFYIPGIIAYTAGALIAWLTTAVCPFFIPPLNGIVVAALVYVILEAVPRKAGI
jgi:hypothetical protein